ncbi:MAG: hypothetical protein H7Y86_00815 [Rhizobacter sp.]|nr:hypothetical protein [Ferruginibacter sp.]
MKLTSFLIPFTIMTLLTGFGRQPASNENRPAQSSVKIITTEIAYHSGTIEGSSNVATWPVAKFAADENAVQYSVKEMKTGRVYTWKQNELPQCAYHVFPGKQDIKDGEYYIGLGRTWSAATSIARPEWAASYSENYGADNKVEITFYY